MPLTTLPVFGVDEGALGPGEELVPGGVERAVAVDEERVGPLDGEQVAQRVGGEDLGQGVRLGGGEARLDRAAGVLERLDRVRDDCARVRAVEPVETSLATRSSSRAPSVNISSTSTPARILMPASCSQVPIGSLQAWTSKVQEPSVSGRTVAIRRETSRCASYIRTGGRRTPLGSVSTTSAPSWSCPSRKTSAVTSKTSPTAAFAGCRAWLTTGVTSMTGMRPMWVSTMLPTLAKSGRSRKRGGSAGSGAPPRRPGARRRAPRGRRPRPPCSRCR